MDAAWKVYVGDRRFDDNQISNLFLKLKYETVGRFTFDFRPIGGDESYMAVNNTLRIFWGDLHKLDGVIQRVDWDDSQYCYHVFGADIRGFLLDRVNTEPSTVSSYTSDIQTQVQYTGCDFPSNIWTGAGDKIGTYTFHYKLGIQNTIRITSATRNIWTNIVERGTVYEHQNGCLYDATKAWEVNKYAGATLRFVSGACKNNVYNVNGNTANRVCIRLPGEPASMYGGGTGDVRCETIDGVPMYRVNDTKLFGDTDIGTTGYGGWYVYTDYNGKKGCEGETAPWSMIQNVGWGTAIIPGDYVCRSETSATVPVGMAGKSLHLYADPKYTAVDLGAYINILNFPTWTDTATRYGRVRFWYKVSNTKTAFNFDNYFYTAYDGGLGMCRCSWSTVWEGRQDIATTDWVYYDQPIKLTQSTAVSPHFRMSLHVSRYNYNGGLTHGNPCDFYIYNPEVYVDKSLFPNAESGGATIPEGTVPGCSRLGDIYEIVTATMARIEPASLAPATLVKDNHIIKYNQTEELSDRTTVVTVMGAD